MFTEKLVKENQALIDFTLQKHKEGTLLPDTYIIDVDQIVENGQKIVDACKEDIAPIFMLKQLGRNPYIAKKLMEVGFKGAVAVDFKDAKILMEHNIPILNVGHIVQPPTNFLKDIMSYGTQHITVYSYEKAIEINNIAKELGITQKILLKIYGTKEALYPGQTSGVKPAEVLGFANKLYSLEYIKIDGLTTFPAFIYNEKQQDIIQTSNLDALLDAKTILQEAGLNLNELNLPSSNCVHNIKLARQLGATAIEPGHALSGTTMMHATHDLPEKIAYLYLSEVSHNLEGRTYIYGGGYYPRGNVKSALVSKKQIKTNVYPFPAESIDYYLEMDGLFHISDPVVLCFRTQMFVTRSTIALVEGLKQGTPELIGLYTPDGREEY